MGVRIGKNLNAVTVAQFPVLTRDVPRGAETNYGQRFDSRHRQEQFVTTQPSIKWIPRTNLTESTNSPFTSFNATARNAWNPTSCFSINVYYMNLIGRTTVRQYIVLCLEHMLNIQDKFNRKLRKLKESIVKYAITANGKVVPLLKYAPRHEDRRRSARRT
jgi:hypothetical protein